MYAVVINYPSNLGLFTRTWREGVSDIKKAEKERISLLSKNPHLNPQNVLVIAYSV